LLHSPAGIAGPGKSSGDTIMNIGSISSIAKATSAMPKMDENQPAIAPLISAEIRPIEVQTANAVQQASATVSIDQVKQAVQDINQSLQSLSQGLEFSLDTDTKEVVIKVVDQQTREVLRQMPSKEALEIAKALDQVLGKLIKTKA
jgi:flagellar protein FlaG